MFVVTKTVTALKLGERPEPAFATSHPNQMKLVPKKTLVILWGGFSLVSIRFPTMTANARAAAPVDK